MGLFSWVGSKAFHFPGFEFFSIDNCDDILDGGSAHPKAYTSTYIQQHKQKKSCIYPCFERDLNPWSQYPSIRKQHSRPLPLVAAIGLFNMKVSLCSIKHHVLKTYKNLWRYSSTPQSVYEPATGWTARVRFSARARAFSLLHSIQTGSGAHRASYQMGKRKSIPGDNGADAWSWPLTSI
jgi:hypothetical protein